MKKAICLILLATLLISFPGCYNNRIITEINSQPVKTIHLDLIPPDVKIMTVSYYKYENNPEVSEKTTYTATQNQLDDIRTELERTSYIMLDENDLLSFSNAAYISAWDIKIEFDKGESLYIYFEGAVSQFITDKLSLPLPHSYYVSADTIHRIQKILIPDFEKDYTTKTQSNKYTKVDNIHQEKVQEVAFFLPDQRKIFKCKGGFIAFHPVWRGDSKFFLRAVKYDVNGNFVWVKNYTDIVMLMYQKINFIEMSDGGFAVTVDGNITWRDEISDTSENRQIPTIQHGYLLKCDNDGNEVWGERLEYDGNGQVEALVENQYGEILTVGCCKMNGSNFAEADPNYGITDIVLMKYDKNGKRTKFRTFGGSDFETFISAGYLPKTGLVINGTTQSYDRDITTRKEKDSMLNTKNFIAAFNDDLSSKWQFVFEGEDDVFSPELLLMQDHIFIAGSLPNDFQDFVKSGVFQFDFEGNLLKSSILDFDSCTISAGQEGDVLIANRAIYMTALNKMQIIKFDQNLKIVDKIEGVDGDGYNFSILKTEDGGFFITYTDDIKYLPQLTCLWRVFADTTTVLCKYNKNGNLEYRKTYDKNHDVENPDIVIPLSNGKVIVDK